jgi:hypothetical protein
LALQRILAYVAEEDPPLEDLRVPVFLALRNELARRSRAPRGGSTQRACADTRNGTGGLGQGQRQPARKPRKLAPPAKMDRLLDELHKQHDEMLQAFKKASLLVLAERDLRARETAQIKADLSAMYEVLERNRRDREHRLAVLIR